MREIGQGTVPTVDSDHETFASLRLAEPSERVNITLDERMLSIQGKRHATIEVRLSAIHTMKLHSTHLAPPWVVILGMTMVWIGYRLMVPPLYRLAFMGGGALMVLARFFTNQPTLTVQTSSGDTHVLYGNERRLNRLSFMFHQLANNKSLAEVRLLLEAIENESSRSWNHEEILPAPDLPVVVHTPHAVDHFLTASGVDIEAGAHDEGMTPEWMPTEEPEPAPPSQFTAFIPAYVSNQTTSAAQQYPADHRPAPVEHPVLMPSPPMHQTTGNRPFLPSFFGAHQAHIPSMMPAPTEETEVAEPLILDAELVEEATMEETEVSVEETTPTPERETLLEPRRTPTLADTSFVPRRIRQLHPKPHRNRGVLSLGCATNQWNCLGSPLDLHDPTRMLRPRPQVRCANRRKTTLHPSGMSWRRFPKNTAVPCRPRKRLVSRLDVNNFLRLRDLGEQDAQHLETLSFSDLQSSKEPSEVDSMPRLDED